MTPFANRSILIAPLDYAAKGDRAMDGLLLGFVVFFVLALACVCALGVVRMLTKSRFADSPPWPHLQPRVRHGRSFHRTRHSG